MKKDDEPSKRFEELLSEKNIPCSQIVPTAKDFNENLQASQVNELQPIMT